MRYANLELMKKTELADLFDRRLAIARALVRHSTADTPAGADPPSSSDPGLEYARYVVQLFEQTIADGEKRTASVSLAERALSLQRPTRLRIADGDTKLRRQDWVSALLRSEVRVGA